MAKRSRKKEVSGRGAYTKVIVKARLGPWVNPKFNLDWFFGLGLFFAVVLIYLPVWWAGYFWDDEMLLTNNPCIVGPLGLKEIWTTSAADVCPLTLTTFWLEHAMWGLAPAPYHIVDVLLHASCAVLLGLVLRSLRVPGAWFGAALWALHPVEVESVAWITEMKNTESGLFFLLSILFFLKWIQARDLDKQPSAGRHYILTLIFAALAMACKSSTVILPGVLGLCAWWTEGRWNWRTFARVAPIFFMSFAASILSIWTQHLQLVKDNDPQWVRTWPERLVAAGDAVWFYLGKLLWPQPSLIYPRWEIDAMEWISYLPLLAVIFALFILWIKRESWSRPYFFAFAYFLVALFPVLGLVDNPIFRYSLVFDHFQYLASMGPLALAGAGMVLGVDSVLSRRFWVQAALGAGVLMTLGALSCQRAWIYQNQDRLWTDILSKNPTCWVAYNNLGNALLQKGDLNEARIEFQKTLEINPNYADAHYNLGVTLLQMGQMDEAMVEWQKALEINPDMADGQADLGNALLQNGKTDEAIDHYQKALKINPNYADAHNNLGFALFRKGQTDEAIEQYQKALAINPQYSEAHDNLAQALLLKGQVDEAVVQLQEVLQLNPHDSNALTFLAEARQKGIH
jgi:protein O-mannosyl-transferase